MNGALQNAFPNECFGCGSLNAHGLQIKSVLYGDDTLCKWQPEPYHIGYPGYVCGGIVASVVDCHCIWTAIAHHCRENSQSLDADTPPVAYVTGALKVNYLKPIPIEGRMELRAAC
jgi:acyl-coenzyme A thioesterase PaaI-like protein